MHRDSDGLLHLAITIYGPWSPALDHDLRWFEWHVPASYPRKRKVVWWNDVWFSQVQIRVPPSAIRREPVQLHVAAMSGTLWSDAMECHLLAHADGVVFVAENSEYRLEHAREYRRRLDEWIVERRDAAIVVFQLDDADVRTLATYEYGTPTITEAVEPVPFDRLREEVRVGDRPCFTTKAREAIGVDDVFREISKAVYAATDAGLLAERPLPAPIERLEPPA